MSRPIKFRAWDKKNNLWRLNAKELSKFERLAILSSEDFEIMQFTGLHDKNGKEIWEGDIVGWRDVSYHGFNPHQTKSYGSERIAKVRYDESLYWRASEHKTSIHHLLVNVYHDCEVLGNIYENPELLK